MSHGMIFEIIGPSRTSRITADQPNLLAAGQAVQALNFSNLADFITESSLSALVLMQNGCLL